jgi:peroxiredoxin Q/BCP
MASVDTLADNTAFAEEHNAGFPILADPDKTVAWAFGVLHAAGFSNRWTFYIDVAGKVARIDREVKPQTAGADLARALGELGFPRR